MKDTGAHIGIDLGGTNIRAAILQDGNLHSIVSARLDASGKQEQVLQQIFQLVDPLMNDSIQTIGIGVPGLADIANGWVYDVVNISSWQKVPLILWMENHYRVPVFVENDANCFALGEYSAGQTKRVDSMAGITIGTGLGTGLILNNKLYSGRNGGAGEFGMMPYLDKTYEYYASGQFFQNLYQTSGLAVFQSALTGDKQALEMYLQFGKHLAMAIQAILFAVDVETIIIGGSVKNAFRFYESSMWQHLQTFPYQRTLTNLSVRAATSHHSGIAGAASLHTMQ